MEGGNKGKLRGKYLIGEFPHNLTKILKFKINLDAVDKDGNNAIAICCKTDAFECLKILINETNI